MLLPNLRNPSSWTLPRVGIRPVGPGGLARLLGALILVFGVANLAVAPVVGEAMFARLWGIEPLTYMGAALVILGLAITSLAYLVSDIVRSRRRASDEDRRFAERWTQVTQQYFDLFNHDLGRPLRRIVGKEREIREQLQAAGSDIHPSVRELLDEIEEQTPSFRLMMSNIQVLIELETPNTGEHLHAVEPAEVVRRIVDRYSLVAADASKQIVWWSEPTEFGIVYCDSSAIEHIVTNLVDNTVRYAESFAEIGLTRDEKSFYIRVWDDGPGIAARYLPYLFDRGWTPEVARHEERTSSGLGLFIAHTLAKRYGGDLTVESITEPDSDHHTSFTLTLPLRRAPAWNAGEPVA
ncbi:MAG: HAMP domain-containing sensor histidine kinase [Chloroflexota bacterium]|nr:HAMP domain-containing sensor histidine kinase [Chloroflexota bacterium]